MDKSPHIVISDSKKFVSATYVFIALIHGKHRKVSNKPVT